VQLQQENSEISEKFSTALEIIGEKEEQIEGLNADLADLKTLYRQHIDMLSKQMK
jgi:hypothetical protein